jgi:hypothetical protein
MHVSSETLLQRIQLNSLDNNLHGLNTDMRRLTTGLRSEKCVFGRFRRRANVIECTYTNLGSIAYCTPSLYIAYCS